MAGVYQRLIFASEVERAGTRQVLSEAFPLGKFWYVCDELDTDFLMDAEFPCSQESLFHYVVTTPGPARLLIYSCYNLSLALFEPPSWMIQELRKSYLK